MTRRIRRKSEVVRFMNERNFPHLVELPLEGFRSVLLEIDEFHRERQIPVRRGRNRYEVKSFYIRFCFSDAATADAFRNRFGGESLTAPEKSARVIKERWRPKRRAEHCNTGAADYGLFVPDVP